MEDEKIFLWDVEGIGKGKIIRNIFKIYFLGVMKYCLPFIRVEAILVSLSGPYIKAMNRTQMWSVVSRQGHGILSPRMPYVLGQLSQVQ